MSCTSLYAAPETKDIIAALSPPVRSTVISKPFLRIILKNDISFVYFCGKFIFLMLLSKAIISVINGLVSKTSSVPEFTRAAICASGKFSLNALNTGTLRRTSPI